MTESIDKELARAGRRSPVEVRHLGRMPQSPKDFEVYRNCRRPNRMFRGIQSSEEQA